MFILLPTIAAIHIASYGAYKDTPYENFSPHKIIREIVLCFIIMFLLMYFDSLILHNEKKFIIVAVIICCSRIITEIYKQFFRQENQTKYKIPSQVHIMKSVVENPNIRYFLSIVSPIFLGTGLFLTNVIYSLDLPLPTRGVLVGFVGGLMMSIAGGYKDGFFEGFHNLKFFRSPAITGIIGFLLANQTKQPFYLLTGSMGIERMLVEFYKTFIKSHYIPGKFNVKKAVYSFWLERRKIFIPAYILSWLIFLILILFHA